MLDYCLNDLCDTHGDIVDAFFGVVEVEELLDEASALAAVSGGAESQHQEGESYNQTTGHHRLLL